MATRATISIANAPAVLYKHWDGYPEAVLPWLTAFIQRDEPRLDNPSYALAQLLRSSVWYAEEFGLDDSHQTGWGLSRSHQQHSDTAFRYTITPDREIVVHQYNGQDNNGLDVWTLIQIERVQELAQ